MKSPTGKPFSKVYMQDGKKNESDLLLPKNLEDEKRKEALNDSLNKEFEDIENYNINLKKLDKRFSKDITLLSGGVMVRLFKESLFNEIGLVQHKVFKVPSPSGTRDMTLKDPFPYLNIGVIVNMDGNLEDKVAYKRGDVVQLNPKIVETVLGQDGEPKIQYMFKSYGSDEFEGYVLIPSREIECILNKFKYDKAENPNESRN